MYLTPLQTLLLILILIIGTMITRFLPFIVFPENKNTPKYIIYLSKVLPYSVIGMLVIYLLKDVKFNNYPFGVSEGVAIFIIIILHLWKKNTLLSIGIGTIIYMLLVQYIFI